MHAQLAAIAYHLPEQVLTNAMLAEEFPEWSVEKIEEKTGIASRHIAGKDECSSDLAVAAAERLFAGGACRPEEIDFVLLCTQSPDYFLPTSACLVQQRLGIPSSAGALDFNLGCSGYIYGLSLARGLIETEQAQNVLLLTAETYSKYIHPEDKSVRTLFGDAAAATLVRRAAQPAPAIGPFVFGTDGSGAQNLIVPAGAMRRRAVAVGVGAQTDEFGNVRTEEHLYMNGPEIFTFTMRAVPQAVDALLAKAGVTMETVDLFVFHQANQYMLDHLRKKIKIPQEKFVYALRETGNTVSSTIPIALTSAQQSGQLQPGQQVMLVGFGVGYSWGAALLQWGGQ